MKNPNTVISSDYGPIIINLNDNAIGRQISQYGYWATDDINIINTLVNVQLDKFGQIVFYDVGANIGTHSLAIAKTHPDTVAIRAFEAQRQVFNMLCGTMAINGLSNVHCHHNAISEKIGDFIDIPIPDYNSANNFGSLELIPPKNSDNQGIIHSGKMESVKTLSIDSFNEKVDFIKMDIEGMEDKALLGAINTIEHHRPILFLEILKTDVNFVMTFLRERGYLGFQKSFDLIAIPIEYQLQVNGTNRVF